MKKRTKKTADMAKMHKMRKIARVASKLFHEKGFMGTTVDEVCAACDITKGGLYYYFSSKVDLLNYILTNFMDNYSKNLISRLEKIEDPYLKIEFIISHHAEFYSKNIYESKLLMDESHCLPLNIRVKILKQETEYSRYVTKTLAELFEGQVDKEVMTVATFCLFGMCNWLYKWYDPGKKINQKQLSKIMHGIFCDGVSAINPRVL